MMRWFLAAVSDTGRRGFCRADIAESPGSAGALPSRTNVLTCDPIAGSVHWFRLVHRWILLAWFLSTGLLASASDTPSVELSGPIPRSRPVDRLELQRAAQRVEPDLVGQRERLPLYLESFRHRWGNDSRLFAWSVQAEGTADQPVRLTGYVEFPETAAALVAYLEILGFQPIEDQLERLPSVALGPDRFGVVQVTHSLGYERPGGDGSVVTQFLLGEPLYVLREEEGSLLVHGAEGYLGYLPKEHVLRMDESTFIRYRSGRGVRLNRDQQTATGLRLPAGCRLRWVRNEGDQVIVRLPNEEMVALPASCCSIPADSTTSINQVIEQGKQFLGTRYLWGGKSSAGVDCSGLVQIAFAAAGAHLPRDSNQQVLLGELSATRWCRSTLRRGDTLYFLGKHGRIRHTAIYLGDDRYLQAESPVVRISSFDPQDPDYDAARDASFAFAKRWFD